MSSKPNPPRSKAILPLTPGNAASAGLSIPTNATKQAANTTAAATSTTLRGLVLHNLAVFISSLPLLSRLGFLSSTLLHATPAPYTPDQGPLPSYIQSFPLVDVCLCERLPLLDEQATVA